MQKSRTRNYKVQSQYWILKKNCNLSRLKRAPLRTMFCNLRSSNWPARRKRLKEKTTRCIFKFSSCRRSCSSFKWVKSSLRFSARAAKVPWLMSSRQLKIWNSRICKKSLNWRQSTRQNSQAKPVTRKTSREFWWRESRKSTAWKSKSSNPNPRLKLLCKSNWPWSSK